MRWQDTTALYQIYPLSFQDSTGEGSGDIPGIIERLDYLANDLGVGAIWLSPFYPSPMDDCGYDISDYRGIHELFGTMEDFDELLRQAHARGMKVMIDFVPNHTSNQHPWFQDAISSKKSAKRDYYVWREPSADGGVPNNWLSMSGGSSWEFDEASGQYYLHTFMASQPDLNWDNPKVRLEMYAVMRFWLDKGVDGFRADAIWPLSKADGLPDDPVNPQFSGEPDHYGYFVHASCKNGPNLHTYLREMADVVAEYDDRLLLLEYYPDDMLGDRYEQYAQLFALAPEVLAPFCFEFVNDTFTAEEYRSSLARFTSSMGESGTRVMVLGNHDQSRIRTRLGERQARAAAFMQLALPGLPVVYYGEEIGMEDTQIDATALKDKFKSLGGMGGRDPERTPMQWSAAKHAGFSTSEPWLPVNPKYRYVNVAQELHDNESFLAMYRRLLALRNQHTALRSGTVVWVDDAPDGIVAWRILGEDNVFFVVANMTSEATSMPIDVNAQLIAATYPHQSYKGDGNVLLNGFEVVLFEVSGDS